MRSGPVLLVLILASGVGADDKEDVPMVSAAEAAKHANKKCTVEMEVKSTGKSKDEKLIFLNSEVMFREKNNFTVVIDSKAAEKFKKAKVDDPAAHFKGKTIRITGTITLFNDRPQIRLDDPEQIQVVFKSK